MRETDHSVSRIELFHDWRYGVIMSDAEQLPVDLAAEETQLPPRDRLIDSAKKLFCRYGINSVGVDAIIEQAGTAKTTLYKLFGSKDGLVEAVLEQRGPVLAFVVSRPRSTGRAVRPVSGSTVLGRRSRSGSAATISSAARSLTLSANSTKLTIACERSPSPTKLS